MIRKGMERTDMKNEAKKPTSVIHGPNDAYIEKAINGEKWDDECNLEHEFLKCLDGTNWSKINMFGESKGVIVFEDTVYDYCPFIYVGFFESGMMFLMQDLDLEHTGVQMKINGNHYYMIVPVTLGDIAKSYLGILTLDDIFIGKGDVGTKCRLCHCGSKKYPNGITEIKNSKVSAKTIIKTQYCKASLKDMFEAIPIPALKKAFDKLLGNGP